MIRLVLARLLPYRSFLKFTLLHVLAMVLVAYIAARLAVNFRGMFDLLQSLFVGAEAWRTVCGLSRWAFFIPGFFTVQLVVAELELKIARAQVIGGLERFQVVLVWALQNVLLVAIALVTTLLTAAALADYSQGFQPQALLAILRDEGGFGLYGLAFLNAAVLCAMLMRRPVPAVMLLALWPLIGEPALGLILDHYGWGQVVPYLPFNSIGTLVTWQTSTPAFNPLAPTTWAAVAYGVGALGVAWARLATLDL